MTRTPLSSSNPQWATYPEHNIDRVQSSDGRVVQYHYNGPQPLSTSPRYTYLTSVEYPADPGMPAPIAYYTYQPENVPDYDGTLGPVFFKAWE